MNIRYIKYCLLAGTLALTSCSKEYLDTYPTNSTSPETAFANTTNVTMAVNGLAKIMVSQHLGSQGFNGEGTIKLYFGEYAGQNLGLNSASTSTIDIMKGNYYQKLDAIYHYYGWHYYYMIITNANEIIDKVDGASGPINEKQYLKAQALSYRAFSYMQLSQLYGNRWVDNPNGDHQCLVLRLKPSDPENMELSSLKDVYAQIYSDLDEALDLFSQANYVRKANFLIDAKVAHAIYARASLIKGDYALAEKHAPLARAGAPLMNNKDYNSGFSDPSSEWIWSSFGASSETLYFYSYQAYIAYNSSTTAVRTLPKRISKELYTSIPVTDIRRDLFLNPEGFDSASFNDETGVVKAGTPLNIETRERFPDIAPTGTIATYMNFKFKANDMPGVGNLNHFRSSEMYLIEAEAKHFLGKDKEAAALLVELTRDTGRDPNYTCDKTGTALFDEIVKYRAIELWGEGFNWFDLKRWKKPVVRKGLAAGGNFLPAQAVIVEPTIGNNWTYSTPQKETEFK